MVLPYPDNLPPEAAQLASDIPVAFPVVAYLGVPKFLIASWAFVALWATVPKTAVHKNDNSLASKSEIRFTDKFLVTTPSGDAVFTKNLNQAQLCCLVPTTSNCRHNEGALRGR